MSVSKLATVLTVTFAVTAIVLFAELLCFFRRRRSSRLRSPQPISDDNQRSYFWTKEILFFNFFCLKSQTRVEPTGAPNKNPEESSAEDPVIDVFKLLEANRPSRFLCTIKEDDGEYVESTSGGGDFVVVTGKTDRKVSLQTFLEAEAAEEKGVEVEDATPCDSPMFFTPVGSPARDGLS